MALWDAVQQVGKELEEQGWSRLFREHGLDLSAPDLKTELSRTLPLKREIPGFEDFHPEGVRAIEPGSPAETAGLQGGRLELELEGRAYLLGGDIVTTMNGRALDSHEALTEAMRALRVGADLTLRVFRAGSYREVRYSLPERPLLPGDVPGDRPLVGVIGGGSRRAARR